VSDELIQAAFDGEADEVERLLDNGVDIEGAGRGDWNALHAAIENQQVECVNLLIKRGADVHRSAAGLSPLAHAVDIAIDGTWQRTRTVGGEPTEVIQALLDAGANPAPALEVAQRYQSQKIIDLLTRSRLA
jgi:ankyrin repeat protein